MKPPRIEYEKYSLLEQDINLDPFLQFKIWWEEAIISNCDMPDAAHLATVDHSGHPDSRVILLKHFDHDGFIFYTNYNSKKGEQLAKNPFACLSILWSYFERQVRIRGEVRKTSAKESANYFASRPREAKVAVYASKQSKDITRSQLDESFAIFNKNLPDKIPCPDYWGGFRLIPDYFEFWQGRKNRLHDRICFILNDQGKFVIKRISP